MKSSSSNPLHHHYPSREPLEPSISFFLTVDVLDVVRALRVAITGAKLGARVVATVSDEEKRKKGGGTKSATRESCERAKKKGGKRRLTDYIKMGSLKKSIQFRNH